MNSFTSELMLLTKLPYLRTRQMAGSYEKNKSLDYSVLDSVLAT